MNNAGRDVYYCPNCKEIYDLIDHIPCECPESDCKMGTKCFNCWAKDKVGEETKSSPTTGYCKVHKKYYSQSEMVLMNKCVLPDCLDVVTAFRPTTVMITPIIENVSLTASTKKSVDKIVETMRSGNTLDELSDKILELIRSKNPNYKPAEIWDIEGNVKNVKEEITVVDKKQNTKIFLIVDENVKLLDKKNALNLTSKDIKQKYYLKHFESNAELEVEAKQKYVGA